MNTEFGRTAESGTKDARCCGAFVPPGEVDGCADAEPADRGKPLAGTAPADAGDPDAAGPDAGCPDAAGLDPAVACGVGCLIAYAAAPPADARTTMASRTSRPRVRASRARRVGTSVIAHP
jgi:hypothetical protein